MKKPALCGLFYWVLGDENPGSNRGREATELSGFACEPAPEGKRRIAARSNPPGDAK